MPIYSGPKVSSVMPMNGSDGISALITIKVTFTEMMSSDTITDSYIYLRPFGDTTQKISCAISLEEGDNKTIVLNPASTLADNTKYEVVAVGQDTGTAIKSLLDEPLLQTFISSFTTAEATPVPPVDPGGGEEPVVKPYVVSSYPRDNQYNISPTAIRLKFDQDISGLTLTCGSGSTPGDFNLIQGEFLASDLEDINIIPVICVDGTPTINKTIFEFVPGVELSKDTTYTIVLKSDKTEDYIVTFQSTYTNFYGDLKLIKGDISKYINISDDLLARYIADYSTDARTTAEQYYNTDNDNAIDWTDPPSFIKEYIRYRTTFELTNTKYIELTTASSMVQLGDFTIQNTVSAQGLKAFLDGLALQLKRWNDELHGQHNRGYAKPVTADKRTSDTYSDGYPDFINRGLRDTSGTKAYDSTTS
jgi:hypothetical protein